MKTTKGEARRAIALGAAATTGAIAAAAFGAGGVEGLIAPALLVTVGLGGLGVYAVRLRRWAAERARQMALLAERWRDPR